VAEYNTRPDFVVDGEQLHRGTRNGTWKKNLRVRQGKGKTGSAGLLKNSDAPDLTGEGIVGAIEVPRSIKGNEIPAHQAEMETAFCSLAEGARGGGCIFAG